jgi:peptidoglycan/LPS O-acetylase OafA/YrhL
MNDPSDFRTPSDATNPRRGGGILWSLLGLLIAVASFGSYLVFIDNHWIRSWGIPSVLGLLLGSAICCYALTRRPRWAGTVASLLSVPATAFFIFMMYFMTLPAVTGPTDDDLALASLATPIQDHRGKTVRLADYAGKGPLLLVFFRGRW